jgi:hypothetical protein
VAGLDVLQDPRALFALAGVFGAAVGVAVNALLNYVLGLRAEAKKRRETLLVEYAEPLRTAARELADRLADLTAAVQRNTFDSACFMVVKKILIDHSPPPDAGLASHYQPNGNRISRQMIEKVFPRHANSVYYYVVSTLYQTVLFLHHSMRFRHARAIAEADAKDVGRVREKLIEVRSTIARRFGVYDVLQDSMGAYASGPDGPLSYEAFVRVLVDEEKSDWVFNLVDKYAELFGKQALPGTQAQQVLLEHIAAVRECLCDLLRMLDRRR